MIHNIAHRGASAYEPENTLRAFDRAIGMDATMLELDVHLSRDGHPVVIHDADMSRIAGSAGRIVDMTLGQIKEFDVGQGERVPTWEKASPTPHKLLTPELISDIRQRGLGVVLWHEERPAELRELVKFYVDGICTNTPDVLAAILKEQKGQICYP